MTTLTIHNVVYKVLAKVEIQTQTGTQHLLNVQRPKGRKTFFVAQYENGSYSHPIELTI